MFKRGGDGGKAEEDRVTGNRNQLPRREDAFRLENYVEDLNSWIKAERDAERPDSSIAQQLFPRMNKDEKQLARTTLTKDERVDPEKLAEMLEENFGGGSGRSAV